MDRRKALKDIFIDNIALRQRAAEFYSKNANVDDAISLIEVLNKESSTQIQALIRQAILRGIGTEKITSVIITKEIQDPLDKADGKVIETVAHSILHEISPLVGRLRVIANREVENYDNSSTKNILERLESELFALRSLYTAAQPATYLDTDISKLIENIAKSIEKPDEIEIITAGRSPYTIPADSHLIEVVVSNGLRNSIEATANVIRDEKQIVINWDETDKDYWIVIFDVGDGNISEILVSVGK